jgi:signal transduction histidine kinase
MTRLEAGGRTVAVLIHDPALSEQAELVRSVSAATRLALENERLAAEVRTQLEAVRASRARIVAAGDAERRRVERDLHDGAQQRLVTLALSIQVARAQADGSNPALASSLDQASEDLAGALTDLRALARGIHPAILADEGLAAAVEALADRSPANVTLRAPAERFTPTVEATAYYVVAEALTNVVKYARASAVTVTIEREGETLRVEVADDGVGGADPTRGSGLAGLDDRVAAAGGRLTVTSAAGVGTVVRAEIPCG